MQYMDVVCEGKELREGLWRLYILGFVNKQQT